MKSLRTTIWLSAGIVVVFVVSAYFWSDWRSDGVIYRQAITFSEGETIAFPDGLSVTLTEINDSRCKAKAGVQCIWEGEISAKLFMKGGRLAQEKIVVLSTVRTRQDFIDPERDPVYYHVLLDDASENSATVQITAMDISKVKLPRQYPRSRFWLY